MTNWWKSFTPITVSHLYLRCDIDIKIYDHQVCFLCLCHNVTLSYVVELGPFTLDLLIHVIYIALTFLNLVTLSHYVRKEAKNKVLPSICNVPVTMSQNCMKCNNGAQARD